MTGSDGTPAAMPRAMVSAEHRAMTEFQGNWNVSQKQWIGARGDTPIVNSGTCVSRPLLDGLAILLTLDLHGPTGPFKGIGLFTWNLSKHRYESAWIDNLSHDGLMRMHGEPTRSVNASIKDASGRSSITERVWHSQPSDISFLGPSASTLVGEKAATEQAAGVPLTLAENRISHDEWILTFSANMNGKEIVVMENHYTRAGPRGPSLHETVASVFA